MMTRHATQHIRVLVCGGRNYADWDTLGRTLADLHIVRGIALIIHGGCPTGADRMAGAWAEQLGIPCARMDAQWKSLGKRAGPVRNQWMIDLLAPDIVLAFPGGAGTADAVARSRAAGIPVTEVEAARA